MLIQKREMNNQNPNFYTKLRLVFIYNLLREGKTPLPYKRKRNKNKTASFTQLHFLGKPDTDG